MAHRIIGLKIHEGPRGQGLVQGYPIEELPARSEKVRLSGCRPVQRWGQAALAFDCHIGS